MTEVQDGPSYARRTVTDSLKEFESLTNLRDGPSQARRTITGSVIPVGVRILVNFKGVFWTIPALIYKVSGLLLLVQFLGG